jgi:glutathione peroxidase
MTQQTIFDFQAEKNNGEVFDFSAYQEKVLLIVNTASKCGFTPQYAGLEKLYEEFREQGLQILAFPSNQFMNQEPLSDEEIADFCQVNYGVSFPVFKKVDVNGKGAHPLFKFLKKEAPGLLGSQGIKWNFTKFLVGRDGKPIKRYAPSIKPEDIKSDIEKYLSTDDDNKR